MAGSAEVASCNWITREHVTNKLAVEALCISLDRGEAGGHRARQRKEWIADN